MALLRQIGSLSQGIASTLVLAPKLPSTLNNVAFFASQKNLVLPKKPLTPFFQFREEKLDTVKKQNPNAKITQQTKVLGDMWKVLGEEQKEVYKTKYQAAMDIYNQKIEAIEKDPKLAPQLLQIKEERKAKMAAKAYTKAKTERRNLMKELGKPKRSIISAFSAFSKEVFPSLHKKGTSVTVTSKLIGEKWSAMTDAQKEPYVARYQKAKEIDDAAMLAWKESLDEDNDDAIKVLNKKMTRKRELKNRSNQFTYHFNILKLFSPP